MITMTGKKQFNTNRPPEIVANELIRDIESYLFDSDIKVIFGDAGHDLVLEFVNQCNSDVEKYYDEAGRSYIANKHLRAELQSIIDGARNSGQQGQILVAMQIEKVLRLSDG